MWIASSLNRVLRPVAAALGNFDGVHLGHQQVMQPILERRPKVVAPIQEAKAVLGRAPYRTVVTFNPHPQEFFSGHPRTLLTPVEEKVRVLDHLGIEQLVMLPFDQALAALTPEEFVREVLLQGLDCQRISVGQDFRFGRGRAGTAQALVKLTMDCHISVDVVGLQQAKGSRISSSRIRKALLSGGVETADQLLGRAYCLQGAVETGQRMGRTLGFPTANLKLSPQKFLPRHGVYAVWVRSLAVPGLEQPQPGVMNVGDRPTVNGKSITAEVHLLDWQGDLYGKGLTVELVHFLRPQQKFDDLEALKAQIQMDCNQVQKQLT